MIGSHRANDFAFPRERSDRRWVDLEQSSPIASYAIEIGRLLGIVAACCLLLVVLLAVQ